MLDIDPSTLVAQAAKTLDEYLQQHLPDYERAWQSVGYHIAEWTRTEEEQVWAMLVFAGRCSTRNDRFSLALALVWFARKSLREEPAQVLLDGVRVLPLGQFLRIACSENWCAIETKKMVISFSPWKAVISALNRLGITSALISESVLADFS